MTVIARCMPSDVDDSGNLVVRHESGRRPPLRYEASPVTGERIFVWKIEDQGGPGLAARGTILSFDFEEEGRKYTVRFEIEAEAPSQVVGTNYLKRFRGKNDTAGSLAKRILEYAPPCITRLTDDQTAWLLDQCYPLSIGGTGVNAISRSNAEYLAAQAPEPLNEPGTAEHTAIINVNGQAAVGDAEAAHESDTMPALDDATIAGDKEGAEDFYRAGRDIEEIKRDPTISSETERDALVKARLGQGQFRAALRDRWENACAVTGCTVLEILRASHIQPWHASTNAERLNSANGLLLVAHLDALFDKHMISFKDDGYMLIAPEVKADNRRLLAIPQRLRKPLREAEKKFLEKHRKEGRFSI